MGEKMNVNVTAWVPVTGENMSSVMVGYGSKTFKEVGQSFDCSIFEVGEKVIVQGVSKGKGFAGTVKRYNFKGGPKTHGQSDRHRAPGSIGAGSSPGRVWKGTKMSGHMGDVKVSQKGLKIVKVDAEKNIIEVKGSIPGANSKTVIVMKENYAS